MSNNLTLSVTLTGDGKQLSGTLKNAQGDVREFSAATERESKKAETALEAPGRQAGTVSEHLRGAQREARTFGTETAQGGRQATQALTQAGNEAQTTAGHLNQLKAVAIGVGVAFTAMGVREFINDTYAAVSSSQQLQASLKTVTGSLGSATKAWDELLVFAAETPFTLDQSVQAFIRMQALGLNPTQAALRSFGNTAAAMGEDMMRMVEAVADATTGEFERLKAFGIRSAVEGDQIAFTFQGVTTRIRNSAADISAYLQSIGENQFAGAMADQMATLSGQSANLEDSIYQLYLAIGEAGATNVFASGLRAASNTVQFLTDNIDTLVSGAEVMAVLIGGRVVVALTTATAAKLAATQQTIAYQLALARMSGVSATAAAGQVALAGATRASAGALALVGGPLGAAMLAGGAIYYFREELGLVTPKVQSATERVDDMTSALDANSEAALKNAKAMLEAEQQFQQFRQATLAMDVSRQRQIVADEQKQWDAIGGHDAFGAGPRSESQQALQDLQVELMNTRNAIVAAGGSVTEIDEKLAKLEHTTRETITPTTGLGEANKTAAAQAKELAKATEAQADALEDLYDRLIPGRRETVQLARDMQTLTLAIAMGTGNIGQNIQAMGLLQQQYIEAQNDTDDLAAKSEDAGSRIANSFTTWGTIADNTLRNVDDSGRDAWLGLVDGSTSALDTVERAFDETIANILHMLTTQKFTFQVAGMLGLDTTGMPGAGGQQGGGGFSLGSLKSGWDTVSGLWGGGSAASTAAAGYGAAGWAGSATGAYTGFAGSAAAGAAQAGTGFMGAASAAAPWLAGGVLIDNVLGLGIVDGIVSGISGLFGGKKTPFYGEFGTGDGVREYPQESAFGRIGFTRAQRLERGTDAGNQDWAGELATTSAALDNMLSTLARSPAEFDAMTAAAESFRVGSGSVARLIQGQLVDRSLKILEAAGHDVTAAWGNLGAEELAARIEQASGAMSVMSASSERLNLQFDVTSSSALRAADNMAQYAGGVQNLASLQDQYFQRYFSDTERAAALQADLTAALNAMGLTLPQNEAGFRALVEAQDQNTDAGGRNYVQLLQLSNGFAQLQDMLGQTETGVRDFTAELSAARDAVSTAEDQVRRAYEVFDRQQYGMQLELLELMGDAEGALALERERELATIDEALRPMRERIWAMQDEAEAQERATKAAQNYIGELTRVRDQLNQQLGNIGNWLDQQQATSGSPEMNLATAQEQLAKQLVLIENGDRDALQNITQYADRVLQANDTYNASSPAGQRIEQDVFDSLKNLPKALSDAEYIVEGFRGIVSNELAAEIERAIFASQYTIDALIDFAADASALPQDLRTILGQQAHRLDSTLNYLLGENQLDSELRQLALASSNNLVATVDYIARRQLSDSDKLLALSSSNTMSAVIDYVVRLELDRDSKRLALESSNAYSAMINMILGRDITADDRTLALDSANRYTTLVDYVVRAELTGGNRRLALSSLNEYQTLIDYATRKDVSSDDRKLALTSGNRYLSTLDYIVGKDIDDGSKEIALASSNRYLTTVNLVLGSNISSADRRLALNSTNRYDAVVRYVVDAPITGGDRRLALSAGQQYEALIGYYVNRDITKSDRTLALNSANRYLANVEFIVGRDISSSDRRLALNSNNRYVSTIDQLIGKKITGGDRRLALNSTNAYLTTVDAVLKRGIPADVRTLGLANSNAIMTTVDGILASKMSGDVRTLALKSSNQFVTTLEAALKDGRITGDERKLLDAKSANVIKTLKTSGALNLTKDEWAVINAASGTQRLQLLADIAFGRTDLDHLKDIDDNTKSLEERAFDQLKELNGLVSEMTRTTDQFVGLNSGITSLTKSINALGVAQAEVARIEKEQAAAEKAERDRIAKQRQITGQAADVKSHISRFDDLLTGQEWNKYVNQDRADQLQGFGWVSGDINTFEKNIEDWSKSQKFTAYAGRYQAFKENREDQLEGLRDQYRTLTGSLAPFANGGWTGPGGKWDAAGIVHAEEFVVRSEVVKQPGVRGMLEALNQGQPTRRSTPSAPLPNLPLLGKNDVVDVLRDLKREVAELRRDNARLQGESNKHLSAANNQRGAAAKGQIGAIERGNKMLKKLEDDKRLEAAKR